MQLPEISYDSLTRLLHQDLYGLPLVSLLAFAVAAIFGGYYLSKSGITVRRRIVEINRSGLQSASEFSGSALGEPSAKEYETPPVKDGGADLEDRLIDALITAVSHAQVNSGRLSLVIDPNAEKKISLAKSTIDFDLSPPKKEEIVAPLDPQPPNPEAQEETD